MRGPKRISPLVASHVTWVSVRSEAESRAAQLDFAGAADRFRAAQTLPAADRSADAMELAIVDVRRREVEELQRESARQD